MSGGSSSSPTRDPYTTLGLDHNASPTQIKVAYRKLALQYHPDRQQHQQQFNNPQQQEEATTKFAAISSAYAILSDPAKKSQYDHLYKFGAFDRFNDGSDPSSEMRDDDNGCTYNTSYRTNTHHAATSGSGYKYTENLSGGYYTNKTSTGNNNNTTSSASSSSAPTASAPPPFFNFIGLKKQDSFFDELLHTPKKKKASSSPLFPNNNCEEQEHQQQPRTTSAAQQPQQSQQKRSGIGFSIRPLGKHLSIHVPSKSEIITSMASGEPLPHHNFGTRVTFSTSEARSSSKHPSSNTTTSLISTTTRIAHGQQRTVKRTVYIQPDGKKEEVIEENGVVKRRHVEELCPPPQPPQPSSSAEGAGGGKDTPAQPNEWKENQAAASCHGWHSLRDCVLGPCLGLQGV
uniref:J domain-containing protein n=1 Tax=Skeletonema marinoi TaxID=267567 RepID=A0A6T5STI3_9STRA|mmetsp:Transcript_526/g.847  ORF Transcript_526/g.847 Transcript_526/m.847 type:complete len:402 (+) Transcript_526:179-1384(+)